MIYIITFRKLVEIEKWSITINVFDQNISLFIGYQLLL